MTGEELYNLYKRSELIVNNCICDDWENLEQSTKDAWCKTAIDLDEILTGGEY